VQAGILDGASIRVQGCCGKSGRSLVSLYNTIQEQLEKFAGRTRSGDSLVLWSCDMSISATSYVPPPSLTMHPTPQMQRHGKQDRFSDPAITQTTRWTLQLRLRGKASLDFCVKFVKDVSVHLDCLRALELEPVNGRVSQNPSTEVVK